MSLKQQLEQVMHRLEEAGIVCNQVSESSIAVRRAHDEVGDTLISLEDSEFTVAIGVHFHQHFTIQNNFSDQSADVAQFVSDFINERSVLTVEYRESKPVFARVDNLDTGASSLNAFPNADRRFWSRIITHLFAVSHAKKSFIWPGPVADTVLSALRENNDASQLAKRLNELSPAQMKELAKYLAQHPKNPDRQE